MSEANSMVNAEQPITAASPRGANGVNTANKSGLMINVNNRKGVSDKWVALLRRADANGDGMIDANEVVVVVQKMLKEQSTRRLYRFMALGLFAVVAVLIGALTGITWRILDMSKETKISTIDNSNYQFLMTKDGLAAVTGGASLDLSGLRFRTEGPSRRSLLADAAAAGGGPVRRRLLGELDMSEWYYAGTISSSTVARACDLFTQQNAASFSVTSPSSQVFANGSTVRVAKVLQQAGCKQGDVNLVTALVQSDSGIAYLVYCDASISGCDMWAYVGNSTTEAEGNATSSSGRRRLQQNNPIVRPVPGRLNVRFNPTVEVLGSTTTTSEQRKRRVKSECFPVDATVEVLGKGAVQMGQLQYGDLVRSIDRSTGSVVYRPVYLFGVRMRDVLQPYTHITVGGRTLVATGGHYVPVCVAGCSDAEMRAGATVLQNRRVRDIGVGDVLVVAAPEPALAPVTAIEVALAQGAFAPFVRGADLLVGGVRSSPHTYWLLDPLAPAWLVPHLPSVYEALLAPLYHCVYCLAGPATSEWLAHGLGLADLAHSRTLYAGYWAVLSGLAAPLAAAGMLARAASRRLARRR